MEGFSWCATLPPRQRFAYVRLSAGFDAWPISPPPPLPPKMLLCSQVTLATGPGFRSGLYTPTLKGFNEANSVAQKVFPELLRRIIIINPPMIFSAIFALVKPFLYQRVIDKIVIVPAGSTLEGLTEHIDEQYIPAKYGGSGPDPDETAEAYLALVKQAQADRAAAGSEAAYVAAEGAKKTPWPAYLLNGKAPITIGGPIPEELFGEVEFDTEGAETVSIAAGQKFPVETKVGPDDVGRVLQWEFMSTDNDCGFELKFTPAGAAAESTVVLIPNERLDCNVVPESGAHACEAAGVYTITFDNSCVGFPCRAFAKAVRDGARQAPGQPVHLRPVSPLKVSSW